MEASTKMEHVDDGYLNVLLALPVPTLADKAKRNSQPRRRKRSSKEPTVGPNPTGFIADILLINAGEDVVESIFSYFDKISPSSQGCFGIVLSATGFILNPIICTRMSTKSFEGSFPIINLRGTYIVPKVGQVPSRSLNITFPASDGDIFGGHVKGSLIAATDVQVTVCSFSHEPGADDEVLP